MKKSIITIIIVVMAVTMSHAQCLDGMIAQPTHVVGKRINANGEVTREFVSDFYYNEDGKLSSYQFPEYDLTARYFYSEDFLAQENISHHGGHPTFEETNVYTYENGQVKTISHLVDQMGLSSYWLYNYYPDGRLERKDFREDDEDDYHQHWIFDYENDGKTVVESYFTSWASQGMLLRQKTTKEYDNNYVLASTLTENYSESGELTSATRTDYGYSATGLLETKTTQTLVETEWQNTSITRYSYDDQGQITEQLEGAWDAENAEWNSTHKITFETSEAEHTYTVSFYKKSGDEWVWDVFNRHTILFGPSLKAQQSALGYYVYEEMNGQGNINQFVFTMETMNEPNYLSVEDRTKSTFNVYPNPANGVLFVETVHAASLQDQTAYRISNLMGQTLQQGNITAETQQINIEKLSAGMYFITVEGETQKFMVQ
jgi:hypothetical protein